jgi:hypothetical protein
MAQYKPTPVVTYDTLGFSKYMERPFSTSTFGQIMTTSTPSGGGGGQLNFDSTQTSGALGDKIQVGNITIDGSAGKIIVKNEQGDDTIVIGDIS